MRDVYPVPDELKKHVSSVSDNLKPGEQVQLNPTLVLAMFRDDIERFLRERAAKKATGPRPATGRAPGQLR